jgi:microcystin-dependent protein
MATRISDLLEDLSPTSNSLLPIVVNGVTRKTTIENVLGLVTGGTVKTITGGTSMIVSSVGSPTANLTISFNLPGMVVPFAGSDSKVPAGWLFCNGQAVLRSGISGYPELFAVVGTTYGNGDGTLTFNVPDLRGRSVANGYGGQAIGGSGGSENVLLTAAQAAMKGHNHGYSGNFCVAGPNSGQCCTDGKRSQRDVGQGRWDRSEYAQGLSDSGTIPQFAGTNAAIAHNNMPPGLVLNYLIKS